MLYKSTEKVLFCPYVPCGRIIKTLDTKIARWIRFWNSATLQYFSNACKKLHHVLTLLKWCASFSLNTSACSAVAFLPKKNNNSKWKTSLAWSFQRLTCNCFQAARHQRKRSAISLQNPLTPNTVQNGSWASINPQLLWLLGELHFCPWQAAAMHLPSPATTRRSFPFSFYLLRLSGVSLFPSKPALPASPSVAPILASGNQKAISQGEKKSL